MQQLNYYHKDDNMNNETKERKASELNLVERTDAIARITRKIDGIADKGTLRMDYLAKEGKQSASIVAYVFGHSTQAMKVFNDGKRVNIPMQTYSVTVITSLADLSKYTVTFTSEAKDVTDFDTMIMESYQEDMVLELQGVNLMPLTRTRKN